VSEKTIASQKGQAGVSLILALLLTSATVSWLIGAMGDDDASLGCQGGALGLLLMLASWQVPLAALGVSIAGTAVVDTLQRWAIRIGCG
jgi:hypothetical protein